MSLLVHCCGLREVLQRVAEGRDEEEEGLSEGEDDEEEVRAPLLVWMQRLSLGLAMLRC